MILCELKASLVYIASSRPARSEALSASWILPSSDVLGAGVEGYGGEGRTDRALSSSRKALLTHGSKLAATGFRPIAPTLKHICIY